MIEYNEQRPHASLEDMPPVSSSNVSDLAPLLMAEAIGASCAVLTSVGLQNNTLNFGPGGFRFGDYWPL